MFCFVGFGFEDDPTFHTWKLLPHFWKHPPIACCYGRKGFGKSPKKKKKSQKHKRAKCWASTLEPKPGHTGHLVQFWRFSWLTLIETVVKYNILFILQCTHLCFRDSIGPWRIKCRLEGLRQRKSFIHNYNFAPCEDPSRALGGGVLWCALAPFEGPVLRWLFRHIPLMLDCAGIWGVWRPGQCLGGSLVKLLQQFQNSIIGPDYPIYIYKKKCKKWCVLGGGSFGRSLHKSVGEWYK